MELTKEQQKVLTEILGQTVTQSKVDEFFADDLAVLEAYKESLEEMEKNLENAIREYARNDFFVGADFDDVLIFAEDLISERKSMRQAQLRIDIGKKLLEHLNIKVVAG